MTPQKKAKGHQSMKTEVKDYNDAFDFGCGKIMADQMTPLKEAKGHQSMKTEVKDYNDALD